jgi:protein O-mannosyl-transferase
MKISGQPPSRASAKTNPPTDSTSRWLILLAEFIVIVVALAAYHNSLSGPFVLDDLKSIEENPTIRHLASAFSPPTSFGVGGRPIINLTFALNYALGGLNVRGFHAFNLIIHALAGLALFGVLRRTLQSPVLSKRFGACALSLALSVTVIWLAHPLQTEAVTYISQRCESLMGLFYLLTLYCFIRSAESNMPAGWQVLSVLACLLGVLSKEIIVSAPAMVLLYDRTFVAGSFHQAWHRRWRYYLGLACALLLLVPALGSLNQRSAGFDTGVPSWVYALTSCRSVVLYLKLSIWPHPLVFDYGQLFVRHVGDVVPQIIILVISSIWDVRCFVALAGCRVCRCMVFRDSCTCFERCAFSWPADSRASHVSTAGFYRCCRGGWDFPVVGSRRTAVLCGPSHSIILANLEAKRGLL